LTIIGVAADVKRFGLEAEAQSEVYRSYDQLKEGLGLIKLALRTAATPAMGFCSAAAGPGVRSELPIESVMTMDQRLSESVAPRRFQMLLFGLFAVIALVMAQQGSTA